MAAMPADCQSKTLVRGEFGHDGVVDANGHAAARAVADTSISDNPPHAPGSALCMSLWDSFWQ